MKYFVFLLWLCPAFLIAQTSFNMTLLGQMDLPDLPTRFGAEYSDCWGYRHSNGTEVAIIGGIEDIFFVNVTSPANPTIIYTHHVENGSGGDNMSLWRDFQTYDHYAYAVSDEGAAGLLVFDLSQVPTTVTMVHQTTEFFTRTHTIFIDEQQGRLYAGGSNTVSNGVVILDLEGNPEEPVLLQNAPLNTLGGGYVHDLYVRNNIAYCSHGSLSKIQIYDMTNTANISVVGTIENYPEAGYNHSSWLNEEQTMLVMCDETHGSDVKLVDVTDPANISNDDIYTFYSELEGAGAPGASVAHNPFIVGDYAYIAYYHDGVQVFDFTDPADIELLAFYDTYPDNNGYSGYDGCWGVYPFFPSGIVIASDQNYGLYVLEIANFPLDIEFVAFEAARLQRGIQLDWSVVDAIEGDRFRIMRSTDGGVTFIPLDEVLLVDGQMNYRYTDYNAFENKGYTYRIDFLQQDGEPIGSPMRFVRAVGKEEVLLVANPVQEKLMVKTREELQQVLMQLFDANGKLVWAQQLATSSPQMEFELSALPPAPYMLSIEWEGGAMNRVIQKIE